ncbi:hypothetical protein L6452_44232 [Arctium lappa]|uniref:Uncharacterized protein n=1 Tax=Arctium lappa TaxID=4217 RepID=A0ACB8XFU7_ARCLA|nr:hypothetical protein L6452_44232 [Arctium lappa]
MPMVFGQIGQAMSFYSFILDNDLLRICNIEGNCSGLLYANGSHKDGMSCQKLFVNGLVRFGIMVSSPTGIQAIPIPIKSIRVGEYARYEMRDAQEMKIDKPGEDEVDSIFGISMYLA